MRTNNGHSNKKKVWFIPAVSILLLVFVLVFRNIQMTRQYQMTDFAMGTVISVQVYGKEPETAAKDILTCIHDLDDQELSWRTDGSEIARINNELKTHTEASLSEDMYDYLGCSLTLCDRSGGALDITIHPIIDLWGIESDTPGIPSEEALQECIQLLKGQKLTVTEQGEEYLVQAAGQGASIDLGALGKGIAADELKKLLDEQYKQDIKGTVVSIGGTILTYGNKPGNAPWQIGIRDPRGARSDMVGNLQLQGTHVVSTSGDYEQYFEVDGKRYHHIFDPDTGYPAESGLMSVTVVCDEGICSDGLSTACYILGMDRSLELLESYNAEAVFVTTGRQVYMTDGLTDHFIITNDDYTLGV